MNAPFRHDTAMVRTIAPGDTAELARIDAFVLGRADGTPFQRPAWMHAICAACGHDWRYFVVEGEKGELVAILPWAAAYWAMTIGPMPSLPMPRGNLPKRTVFPV